MAKKQTKKQNCICLSTALSYNFHSENCFNPQRGFSISSTLWTHGWKMWCTLKSLLL